MGKGSKKGRLTGGQRKEINDRIVHEVMDETSEEIQFARVIKHLGAGNLRVILANKREGIARIRNILSRRGSTPIVTDDIVIITGRDFESNADEKLRFDVLAVMKRSDAAKMEKAGRIPAWMLLAGDRQDEDEGDIFDYSERVEEADEEDIDIEKI